MSCSLSTRCQHVNSRAAPRVCAAPLLMRPQNKQHHKHECKKTLQGQHFSFSLSPSLTATPVFKLGILSAGWACLMCLFCPTCQWHMLQFIRRVKSHTQIYYKPASSFQDFYKLQRCSDALDRYLQILTCLSRSGISHIITVRHRVYIWGTWSDVRLVTKQHLRWFTTCPSFTCLTVQQVCTCSTIWPHCSSNHKTSWITLVARDSQQWGLGFAVSWCQNKSVFATKDHCSNLHATPLSHTPSRLTYRNIVTGWVLVCLMSAQKLSLFSNNKTLNSH